VGPKMMKALTLAMVNCLTNNEITKNEKLNNHPVVSKKETMNLYRSCKMSWIPLFSMVGQLVNIKSGIHTFIRGQSIIGIFEVN